MHRYRSVRSAPSSSLIPLRYWKPIQTGVALDDDTSEVRRLGSCRPGEVLRDGVRLRRPLSPHLAARLSGVTIEVPSLLGALAAQPPSTRWIVEGAGGVLVPINGSQLMVDLMVRLGFPVLVVARAALGTINHTLMTLEALSARSLAVAGVVMVGRRNLENRRAIETYGRVRVLGELPRLGPLTPRALARWAASELDAEGRLQEWLR